MNNQPLSSKLAEVKFRKLISIQHLGEKYSFKDEPTSSEFKKLIRPKLKKTKALFQELNNQGYLLSPFLEVGAEYGFRASLLVKYFNANGFAVDISLHSLVSARKISKGFAFNKLPQFICADAYTLPFKNNSFPFVFIYETLHHFPTPKPVISEIYRVTKPGGTCLIGADPIKQKLQLNLWRRPNKLRPWEKFLKYTLILPFISQIGKTETDYGILENAFDLNVWKNSLDIFDKVELQIETVIFKRVEKVKKDKNGWSKPGLLTKLLLNLGGGGIQAICFKDGRDSNRKIIFICPSCLKKFKKEETLNQNFKCVKCQTVYGKYQNVLVLLEKNLKSQILK